MPRCVALLRAINVAGRNMISMAKLREFAEGLGFTNVTTLLQSGNLVFEGKRQSVAALERLLESESAKHFDAAVDYCVRDAAEWEALVAANPFPKEAESDPGHLVVLVLKKAPKADDVQTLRTAIKGSEVIEVVGKQMYAVYPDGIGNSKLTMALIEKKLGTRGTGRNWNTVLKLAALLGK
jgi:uncharacterized protein (DUF1697 family)